MNEFISPKYLMFLINQINDKIWEQYKTYNNVNFYIRKWHKYEEGYNWNDYWENFKILNFDNGRIDLKSTLHTFNGEDLIKIAIDLGIDTPDFIPSVPTIKNDIKQQYENVYDTFTKALKNVEQDPSIAIGLINSTFESLIKEILKDERISCQLKGTETLYKLTQLILKEFNLNNEKFPIEVKTISSSLLSISQSIEKIRSDKTIFHGKTREDILIDDSLYAYLIVNSMTTIALFLNSFYTKKYPKPEIVIENNFIDEEDDLPF